MGGGKHTNYTPVPELNEGRDVWMTLIIYEKVLTIYEGNLNPQLTV